MTLNEHLVFQIIGQIWSFERIKMVLDIELSEKLRQSLYFKFSFLFLMVDLLIHTFLVYELIFSQLNMNMSLDVSILKISGVKASMFQLRMQLSAKTLTYHVGDPGFDPLHHTDVHPPKQAYFKNVFILIIKYASFCFSPTLVQGNVNLYSTKTCSRG